MLPRTRAPPDVRGATPRKGRTVDPGSSFCDRAGDDRLQEQNHARRLSRDAETRPDLAVARAKEGDQEALRFLYVSYSHNIYGYVRSIVRDDHEAEDVTQHVFAKLMTTIGKYDDRGVPFFAWLLRLARNVAIDHLRANRMTPTENVLDPDASSGVDLDRRRDRPGRARDASRRAARGRDPAPRHRTYARRDRRPNGSDRGLDPRPASPRAAGPPARADADRVHAVHPEDAPARRRLRHGPRSSRDRRRRLPAA